MAVIGFHASHEQVHPTKLLEAVVLAEQAGFGAAMCSDHLAPWSERQGHSAFAWTWLGAALQATNLRFGIVNAPGQRYHPAIIAQAIATIGAMYPNRFWAALGSGEASNEHVTGTGWPAKHDRNARLEESVGIIRRLLDGEEVTHHGHVTVDRARVWTLPETPPPLIGAAVSAETAAWVAGWADGLATVASPTMRAVRQAYLDAGGTGPTIAQLHLSWAPSDDEALAIAHDQWRSNVFPPPICWDVDTPQAFDAIAAHVTPGAMRDHVAVSSDPGFHIARIEACLDAGFDEVYLHHVGQEQTEFIETFGDRVLPEIGATA